MDNQQKESKQQEDVPSSYLNILEWALTPDLTLAFIILGFALFISPFVLIYFLFFR